MVNIKFLGQLGVTINLILLATSAQAASLVRYDDPVSTAAGVTAGQISSTGSEAGIFTTFNEASPTGSFLSTYDTVTVRPPSGATSGSSAVSNNSYFQFDVAADSGLLLNLSSLNFGAFKGGDSDPRGWVLRSSVDGFSVDIDANTVTANPFSGGSTEPDAFNVDLSAAQYQGLADITFRMYAYAPTENFAVNFTDLELRGVVTPEIPTEAVPEPASLLGLAALGAVGFATRRKLSETA
jgi:hypothetical protein